MGGQETIGIKRDRRGSDCLQGKTFPPRGWSSTGTACLEMLLRFSSPGWINPWATSSDSIGHLALSGGLDEGPLELPSSWIILWFCEVNRNENKQKDLEKYWKRALFLSFMNLFLLIRPSDLLASDSLRRLCKLTSEFPVGFFVDVHEKCSVSVASSNWVLKQRSAFR